LPLPDRRGQGGADALPPFGRDRLGRQVGVRIHAVRPGQDAFKAVGAVLEGLTGLRGDADGRLAGADENLPGAGLGIGRRAPDQDEGLLLAGAEQLAQVEPFRTGQSLTWGVAVNDIGQGCQTGDDPDAVGDLAGKKGVGLGRPAQQIAKTLQDDAIDRVTGGDGLGDRLKAGLAQQFVGDLIAPRKALRSDAAAVEFVAQAEQIPLPHRLVVG